MVTLSDPYRSLASPRGDRPGGLRGAIRAQSGRSVEVVCKFWDVDVSLLRAPMVTLSDPYRRVASQGGVDQGGLASWREAKVVILLTQNNHSVPRMCLS